jgi:hypothetical protein
MIRRLILTLLLLAGCAAAQDRQTGTITAANAACTPQACVFIETQPAQTTVVAVQVVGSFTGTLKPERTVDGTTWVAAGADITTAGVTVLAVQGSREVRLRASALSAGTPAVTLVRSRAATGNVTAGTGAPGGACAAEELYVNNAVPAVYACDGGGAWQIISGGGGGTPGGVNGQIQYNNAGAFGGLNSTGTGDVVRQTSPTIVTPTIASFVNAAHAHFDTPSGGQLSFQTALSDGPGSFAGQGGKYVKVNAGATALEYSAAALTASPLTAGTFPKASGATSLEDSALSEDADSINSTKNIEAPAFVVPGGSVPLFSGTPGVCPASAAGQLVLCASSTGNRWRASYNAGAYADLLLSTDPVGGSGTITVPNEGTTGTTLNKLAKLTGAPSTAIILATTDTGLPVGIVTGGAGTAGNATITTNGIAACVFDGATTAGNFVTRSSTTAGNCVDAGATITAAAGTGIIGVVLSTNGGAGTYNVLLKPDLRNIFGTANRVLIAGTAGGGIQLTLPQDIATASSPLFSGVTATSAFESTTYRGWATANVSYEGGAGPGGGSSNATPGNPGRLEISGMAKSGGTVTSGALQCASAARSAADCASTSATNFLGIALTTANPVEIQFAGTNRVAMPLDVTAAGACDGVDCTTTVGHFVCSSANTAHLVQVQSTACAAGRQIGIIFIAETDVTSLGAGAVWLQIK